MLSLEISHSGLTGKGLDPNALYYYLLNAVKAAFEIYYAELLKGIPHDTGFLARSFEELRRYTNSREALPPLRNRRPSGLYKQYRHYGISVDRTAANAHQFGNLRVNRNADDVGATFTNTVRYYPVNDIYGHPSGKHPPWLASAKALRKAIEYLERILGPGLDNLLQAHFNDNLGPTI